MSILIVYAGKYGTTKKCAEILNDKIKEDCSVVDLNSNETINLQDYDRVVIGSNIRMGNINKNVKNFLNKNKQLLLEKQLYLFLCCGESRSFEKYVNACFDNDIVKHFSKTACFGGEINNKNATGIDRCVIKMIGKAKDIDPIGIKVGKISEFARDIIYNR